MDTKSEKKVTDQPRKRSHFTSILLWLVLLAFLAGAYFYLQPLFADFLAVKQKISGLENRIATLSADLNTINHQQPQVTAEDITALNNKIEYFSKLNTDLLQSKAGATAVLGIIERLDTLELKVKKLGKISSQGALILTAATLVKEASQNGEPFVYEATVLSELSKETAMEKSAEIIAEIAPKGLPSAQKLIQDFNALYQNQFAAIKPEPMPQNQEAENTSEKGWKENLTDKLSSLISIEKHEENTDLSPDLPKDEIYELVNQGNLEFAAFKMENNPNYQTENFEIWKNNVRSVKLFNQAISHIKALTLGVMKAENLSLNQE